jgi:hypothetical protein
VALPVLRQRGRQCAAQQRGEEGGEKVLHGVLSFVQEGGGSVQAAMAMVIAAV